MITITKSQNATIDVDIGRLIVNADLESWIVNGETFSLPKEDTNYLKAMAMRDVGKIKDFVSVKEIIKEKEQ